MTGRHAAGRHRAAVPVVAREPWFTRWPMACLAGSVALVVAMLAFSGPPSSTSRQNADYARLVAPESAANLSGVDLDLPKTCPTRVHGPCSPLSNIPFKIQLQPENTPWLTPSKPLPAPTNSPHSPTTSGRSQRPTTKGRP